MTDEPIRRGDTIGSIRIDTPFEGPQGSGNGGWSAARLVDIVGQPATVAIRAPVPLAVDLDVVEIDDGWVVMDSSGDALTPVLHAARWVPEYADTNPVSVEAARRARRSFEFDDESHPAPRCFSCGIHDGAMGVQAGPLGDGRYATDWTVPGWAVGPDGSVDVGVLWAAIDCTAAWFANGGDGGRRSFTVQFAAEVLRAPEPGATYALVGWAGDWGSDWDGRKRSAASAAFADDGTCIARSRSFWVAVD